jgi:hypothetical protein
MEERETLKGVVPVVDVKRRATHTMIYQGEQKIRVESEFVREIGCKIARLQWRPFFEKPKYLKQYLCMSRLEGDLCYVERVCLYHKDIDEWFYDGRVINVHCWMDISHLPRVPDFTKQIIEYNKTKNL